jgi:mono/diheme cytochrome c family protein
MALRKALKGLGLAALGCAAIAGTAAAYVQVTGIPRFQPPHVALAVDVTPERVTRGRRTAAVLCVPCHLDRSRNALSGRAMSGAAPQFGTVYSPNITQDREYGIGAWSDGEIAYLVRTGVTRDGRYTPAWMPKFPLLADEDLADVIAFLRSDDPQVRPAAVPDRPCQPSFLTKAFATFIARPLPYPAAPIVAPHASDRVAYGRYLVTAKLDCHGCHSRSFTSINALEPEETDGYLGGGNPMRDPRRNRIFSANLTPDATGLCAWSEADFRRAMKLGLRPDGRAVRPPMPLRPELTDDEVAAMWAYLRTVPPIPNPVPTPFPEP